MATTLPRTAGSGDPDGAFGRFEAGLTSTTRGWPADVPPGGTAAPGPAPVVDDVVDGPPDRPELGGVPVPPTDPPCPCPCAGDGPEGAGGGVPALPVALPPEPAVPVDAPPPAPVPAPVGDGAVPLPDDDGGGDPAVGAAVVVVGVGPGVVARTALGGTEGGWPAPKAQPSTLPGGGW